MTATSLFNRFFPPLFALANSDEPRLRVAPMHTIRGLIPLLDRNEDEILKLITSGQIAWAFDIGLSQKCREVRVLPAAVVLYQNGIPCKLTFEEVAASLVPDLGNARPGVIVTLTGLEIQRILNAGGTHVQELLDTRQLKRITESRSGPNGSPKVDAESFLKFLKRRRLT